jgi:hypothetical protein
MSAKNTPSHKHIRVVPIYKPKKKVVLGDLTAKGKPTELFDQGNQNVPPKNARLTYNGGVLLPNVKVFTVFWGSAFQTGALTGLPDKINLFFDTMLQSALMDQMKEYNTGSYNFGKGARTGSIIINEAVGATVSDSDIQAKLQGWVTGNPAFPQPANNTLYFIYIESGTIVSMDGGSSCASFCGYHNNIGQNIFYAVMPYPDCAGCTGNLNVFDALTGTSSHELCEAITDPIPGAGLYDNGNNMEIGDLCAWNFKRVDGYNVQLEWSNKAKQCI